jgi:unsaturated rhamnogalacturonyl hydrolase
MRQPFNVKNFIRVIFTGLALVSCVNFTLQAQSGKTGLEMAVRMAESEMVHFPESWTVDFRPQGSWNYTPGLIALAMMEVYEKTGDLRFYEYAKSYADRYIREDGSIDGYKLDEYNIDRVNSGKFLFPLFEKTGNAKYEKAIILMRSQLDSHPRTSEGGFWHKKVYPSQMWLDGLYMGAPFYAQYATKYNQLSVFNDIIDQFMIVNRHTYDKASGLNYHGWDESREQKWARPETGTSPHFWGRAMGWYAMALVDVLDYIPATHPRRIEILNILNQVAVGVKKHQDKKTGLWYQVMDQGNREGNYLESSASAMFVYTLLKAARMGYIKKSYRKLATKGYEGMLSHFIKENENGTISLTDVCAVAGLGGTPYRDGSFDYYISEPRRDNDPKGVGPFILASLEMNYINK